MGVSRSPRRNDFDVNVSSHTPAWGGIRRAVEENRRPACFKSYPRVGGIRRELFLRFGDERFKSYPRVGSAQLKPACCLPLVSSHTPAWGVSISKPVLKNTYLFQVIPPRGGYQPQQLKSFHFLCFKSYPRVGGITSSVLVVFSERVSSHTPAWGVSPKVRIYRKCRSFKSYPRVGGIPKGAYIQKVQKFQVIPPRGGYRI